MDDERCECGVLLSKHPPLPKPGPFPSWRESKATKPTSKAGPLVQRSKGRAA